MWRAPASPTMVDCHGSLAENLVRSETIFLLLKNKVLLELIAGFNSHSRGDRGEAFIGSNPELVTSGSYLGCCEPDRRVDLPFHDHRGLRRDLTAVLGHELALQDQTL